VCPKKVLAFLATNKNRIKGCSLLGLGDITLGARSRHAKEANCVVEAHGLLRLVFFNNEANKVLNSMTSFPSRSRLSSFDRVHGGSASLWRFLAQGISALRKKKKKNWKVMVRLNMPRGQVFNEFVCLPSTTAAFAVGW
jgi:hypothetical protein